MYVVGEGFFTCLVPSFPEDLARAISETSTASANYLSKVLEVSERYASGTRCLMGFPSPRTVLPDTGVEWRGFSA